MILSLNEERKINSLIDTVMTCLSFLSEQSENSDEYLFGIRHTVQQLIAVKVSEITLSTSIDIDSVKEYLKFDIHVESFSSPHTIERNNKIREQVKSEVMEYLQFIDENL